MSITPDVAEFTCVGTVRRTRLPNGPTVLSGDNGVDDCGRAELAVVLRNCSNDAIDVDEALVRVEGPDEDGEGVLLGERLLPGGHLRIVAEPRGIGEVTVTFAVQRVGSSKLELPVGRARIREVVRTTYE